jgi:hypothetical protein
LLLDRSLAPELENWNHQSETLIAREHSSAEQLIVFVTVGTLLELSIYRETEVAGT